MGTVDPNENGIAADTSARTRGVAVRVLGVIAIALAAILAVVALVTLQRVFEADAAYQQANDAYYECSEAASTMQTASDYLTSQSRVYVSTGNREYLDNYLNELLVDNHRDHAVETLRAALPDQDAAKALQNALDDSNKLAERELYAMRLTADATNLGDMPQLLAEVKISSDDAALSDSEKHAKATDLVLDNEYQRQKTLITNAVNECSEDLNSTLSQQRLESDKELRERLTALRIIVIALLCIVVFAIFILVYFVLWPLRMFTQRIRQGKPLEHTGASELHILVNAYNAMYEENRLRTTHLRHEAEHDALTDLFNRRAYDELVEDHRDNTALLLIDIDKFKGINDTHGHIVGDEVLKRVANVISSSFRPTDFPCRIGGDEFAVIVTGVRPELKEVIAEKIESIAAELADGAEYGIPNITLSVGIAFNTGNMDGNEIYRAADKALYEAKERGRNGYAFYSPDTAPTQ